eukprot:jgi/Mesen1/8539/ME000484S07925
METKTCALLLVSLALFAVSQARPLDEVRVSQSGPTLSDVEKSAKALGLGPNWRYEGNPAGFLATSQKSKEYSSRRELDVKTYDSIAQQQLALAWHCLLISQYWSYGTACFDKFQTSLDLMRGAQADLTKSDKQSALPDILKAKAEQDACKDNIDDSARDRKQAITYLELSDDYVDKTLAVLPTPSVNTVEPAADLPLPVASGSSGNPIDECWRGGDWKSDRQKLADCALGYGVGALGGKGGAVYTVTSTDDDPINPAPGTLRWGVVQETPLWIIFDHDMTFDLKAELIVTSFKTIDGRGANILFKDSACITLQEVTNVIVHNIKFHNCVPSRSQRIISSTSHTGNRGSSDGDSVSIWKGSDIWVDHCEFITSADGLVDVIAGSTGVTISNNFFDKHDKVMLLGAHDGETDDDNMKVTVMLNKFGPDCTQRLPRARRGRVHVVNNYYPDGWGIYAVGGSSGVRIRSEGNFFAAPNTQAKEVTKLIEGDWSIISINDHLANGATFHETGSGFSPEYSYSALAALDLPQATAAAGAIAY